MTQWEYKLLAWAPESDYRVNHGILNEQGKDGWELVAFDKLFAYLKRPIPEKDPVTERIEFARDFFAGGVM